MTRSLYINGHLIDLTGVETIATTYQASPIAEPPAAEGIFSVEFTIPPTNNNRQAFGIPDQLPNDSALPFRLLSAQYYEDGVDKKIDSCQLLSVQEGLSVRLYGGITSLIAAIGSKSLRDIDLSAYDHVRNHANIAAALQGTSGYLYPLIDYLNDISGDNVAMESMYPSMFLHTVMDAMLDDVGYTLTGDLTSDTEYKSVLLPFSSKQSEYSAAFLAALQAKMYLPSALTFEGTAVAGKALFSVLADENDDFDLIWSDPLPKYHALINAVYEFNAYVTIQGTPSSSVTVYLMRQQSGYPVDIPTVGTGSVEIIAGDGVFVVDSWSVTGSDFASGTAVIDETVTIGLRKGDRVWLAFSKNDVAATFDNGSSTTFLECTDITDYGIFYGDTWQMAPNLPDIKQTDLIKWVIKAFSCIAELDTDNKQLILTRFKNVVNNFERDDWSELLDLTTPPKIEFPKDLAQVNTITYADDENIIKPEGADYSFTVDNKNLPPDKVFYEAPFGVTVTVEKFTDTQNVPRIDILSNQLKPRILVYKAVTLSTGVNLQVGAVTSSTQINVCVPYFIDPSQTFNLGWRTNLIPKYGTEVMQTITRPRILTAMFRLNPSIINQLDFSKPVWIDKYNSYFYKVRINQYEAGESTECELLSING